MTECSTPPGEDVWWVVEWVTTDREAGVQTVHSWPILAPTAYSAWQKVHGAPAFGSCRVRRVTE